ncbi:MAG: glycosyltransferase family 4 protein [Rhizobiaceae bacterium]|nr:glycosyltransferase family 4 protein [Rhizobiaceae bacterium]
MDAPLRIVHCFRAPVGGVFRHVRDLALEQTAQGHSVGLVCDSTTGGDYEAQLIAEIEPQLALGVTRVRMQRHVGPGDVFAAARTYKALKKLSPDILHGHGAKGGVYARVFGTALRGSSQVRRFYSPHGGSLHYDAHSLKGRLYFTAERMLQRLTDGLFFVCQYEREVYRHKIGPIRTESHVVYNGLRPEEFTPVEQRPNVADFLFIGTLRHLKGPDIFIDALAIAQRAADRQLTAVIVGDGEFEEACRSLAEKHGLTRQITFRPAMPAREAFSMAKAVIVPSRAESFPYVVLEALAAGKPVIATRVGGIAEALGENSPALCNAFPQNLAEKLVQFVRAPEDLIAAMPVHSELQQRFSLKAMSQQIVQAYTQRR